MPSVDKPTVDTFAAVEHRKLTRIAESTSTHDITLVTTSGAQYMSYVPPTKHTGISYGDSYTYAADGQLWLVGGRSNNASDCGLERASSFNAWASASSNCSARLDYHGEIKEVTSAELKKILASA